MIPLPFLEISIELAELVQILIIESEYRLFHLDENKKKILKSDINKISLSKNK